MGKKHKKKKHLARLRVSQNKPLHESASADYSVTLATNNNDGRPRSEVASDIEKISLTMIGLATVVVAVAILNSQTNYVRIAGKTIMRWLGIE